MSRGSTLTLYRAYRNFKVSNETHHRVVKCYADYVSKHGFGDEKTLGRKIESHLPPILHVDTALNLGAHIMGRQAPSTVEELRERSFTGYYLREERFWCDKLLEWNFPSGFDALVEAYDLRRYEILDDAVLISEQDARMMLTALEYLLSAHWDRVIENAMDNRYVKLFADGGNAYGYSKYVDRDRWARQKDVLRLEGSGCKVTVELPKRACAHKTDDDYWREESSECDEEMERWFRDFATGLRAYLESDNWHSEGTSKLVLEYSAWG